MLRHFEIFRMYGWYLKFNKFYIFYPNFYFRQKRGSLQSDSVLLKSNQNLPPSLEFERSDSTSRLRLVLGELLYVSSQIHEQQQHSTEFYMKQSDLFDNAVYIPEICDVLSIAISELPALLTIQQVTGKLKFFFFSIK